MKNQKIVLIQGAFDIINAGHVRALINAKKQGDVLIVALNTDELHRSYKDNRGPIVPFRQRKEILEALECVDKIISISTFSPLRELKKYNVDVYIITEEWERTKKKEIKYMIKKGGKIIFSERPSDIMCSTDIRKKIFQRESNN